MLKFFGIVCVLWSIFADSTMASVEDAEKKYADLFLECVVENPISEDDLAKLDKDDIPDNDAMRCLFACVYKKSGVIDENGKMSADGIREVSEKFFPDDEEMMKDNEEFIKACMSVNDEPVTDGNKGCERAGLMHKCASEKTPDLLVLNRTK